MALKPLLITPVELVDYRLGYLIVYEVLCLYNCRLGDLSADFGIIGR